MKLIFTFFILLLINSCIVENDSISYPINVSFTLSDSTGMDKYVFQTNEEFIVNFKIENNSENELNYYSALPVVYFQIVQEDSVICSSCDKMGFPGVMVNGKIKSGDVFEIKWFGPNSDGRKNSADLIVLQPGHYQIEVFHKSFFSEYKLPNTKAINFDVVN